MNYLPIFLIYMGLFIIATIPAYIIIFIVSVE